MILRDKHGWPVETIKGRPVINLIRRVLWVDICKTWKHRNRTTMEPFDYSEPPGDNAGNPDCYTGDVAEGGR